MENRDNENCKDRKVSLFAEAGVLVGDDIYFFSSAYNLLYKVHMPDFVVSIISHIPCRKVFAFEWFRKARYWNGKLIFIPSYAEKIWIYDLNSGEWDSIIIDYPQMRLKFWGAVVHQDNVFLFGILYPVILKVNLNDHSVSYLEIEHQFKQKKEEEGLFFTDAVRVGHMAFCPISICNQVFQFDLNTLEYKWHQIGDTDNRYSGIDCQGDWLWISSGERGRIVKWNGGSEWEEFEVPREITNRCYQFIGVICDGDKIRFLTQQDGESLDIAKDAVGRVRISLTEATKRYVHLEHYENGTIVLMQSNAYIDVKWKGKWIKGICEISYEDFKAYFDESLLWDWDILSVNGNAYEAGEIFKVSDYIEIEAKQEKNPNKFFGKNDMGTKIWKVIKENI